MPASISSIPATTSGGRNQARAARLCDRARDADIAVVYYAGHGIEVDGANYLSSVMPTLERDTDVYDEALSLERVLIAIEPAKKLRLVILDACRTILSRTMKRTSPHAPSQRPRQGRADQPKVLIAYSAKAGSTAAMATARTARSRPHWRTTLATPGSTCAGPSGTSATCSRARQQAGAVVYGSLARRRAAGGRPPPPAAVPAAAAAAPAPPVNAQDRSPPDTNWRCRATRAR